MKLSIHPIVFLLATSSAPSSSVLGYFARANNAHVEFVSSTSGGSSGGGGDTTGEDPSTWKAMIEAALNEKLEQLSFSLDQKIGSDGEDVVLSSASSSSTTTTTTTKTADAIMNLFEGWMEKFNKEYQTSYEKGSKILVWLENHGAFVCLLPLLLLLAAGDADIVIITTTMY